jgi:hypothetical protein
MEVAGDAEGDVVALFDPDLGPSTVWSIHRDADTSSWPAPSQISPAGYDILLPTLSQNESGDAVYAVYLVRGGGPVGLYAHRWDGASNTWGPAVMLPGSEEATFGFAGPVSRFPLVVGGDGEATLLWQADSGSEFTVYASRTEGGVWQAPVPLLAPSPDDVDIENFAYADANPAGDVLGAFTRFESGANQFYAFRYRAGLGFDETANPYTSSSIVSTRVRTSFYSGARAVGTLYGPQGGQSQITSLRYTGLNWLPDLVDIPLTHQAFLKHIVSDRFETLLVYEAEQGGNLGIVATWFRASVGDLDCDGDVDLIDVANIIGCGSGPGVPFEPGCEEADLDGDGDVDFADGAILQLVFTGD